MSWLCNIMPDNLYHFYCTYIETGKMKLAVGQVDYVIKLLIMGTPYSMHGMNTLIVNFGWET